MSNFSFKIVDGVDYQIEEKNNVYTSLRKIKWGDSPDAKLDLRKYYSTTAGEKMTKKGLSFLTEDGPNELIRVLIELGYGDEKEIIKALAKRNNVEIPDSMINDESYFDINDILSSVSEGDE